MEPITEFLDETQAKACLKEWQSRLFLDDWVIKLAIVEHHEMPQEDCDGINKCFNTLKACKITISKKRKDDADNILRHCEEYTLVHELLHCKPWLTHYTESQGSISDAFVEQHEHTLLDQLAKSLIMAKYGVGLDWFENI